MAPGYSYIPSGSVSTNGQGQGLPPQPPQAGSGWLKSPALSEPQKQGLRTSSEEKQQMVQFMVGEVTARIGELSGKARVNERVRLSLESMARELAGQPELRGAYHSKESATYPEAERYEISNAPSKDGQIQTVFGPESHLKKSALKKYDKKVKRWNWLRKHVPQFRELRRFVEQ
jgi:hypothetical protein